MEQKYKVIFKKLIRMMTYDGLKVTIMIVCTIIMIVHVITKSLQ